ncbi:DUF5313 family protein [Actinokineospora fastidiosa]|uniref:DUF5313 domain-containing protein n=1 Tax=Actinokineospora fastidiosa TaxID=1816 RepID=A0A918GEC1_9PSEU|nr:DUF5313 family protein [Actinokineospora fastidiosa]GGS31012.1 hypothetical protein GCM10010171_26020 [Actinokineospora fastidiosa]
MRPNPVQWLWYAVGGRLPDRLREWVLHDVTARTWVLRHAARASVLLAPIAVVCLLVPGPLPIRLGMVGLAVIIGYYFSFSYLHESAEMRAARHGYPYGTARDIRSARHAEADAEAQAHYDAAYRQAE